MNFKKIALAAAAAAAATPAMAADLPVVAEPVNYVQACDAYGAGYFQLPGQDTCVKVHGRIRTQWTSHNLTAGLGDTTTEAKDATLATLNNIAGYTSITGVAADDVAAVTAGSTYTTTEKAAFIAKAKAEVERRKADPADGSGEYANVAARDAAVAAVQDQIDDLVDVEVTAAVAEETNDYSAYAKGYVYLESMTSTEFAMIKTYTELTAQWDDHDTGTSGVGSVWVQLGFDNVTMTIGRLGSSWSDFGGYSNIGVVGISEGGGDPLQVQLAASLGNGFTAQFGIEDSNDTGGVTNRVNFAGNIGVTQGMFSGTLSGVAHAYADSEYGYAVAAHASVTPMENVTLGFGASYGQSALNHLGLDGNTAGFTNAGEAKGFVVAGGAKVGLSDKLTAALDGSYAKLEQGSADWNITKVNGSLTYVPAAGLEFVLDGGYSKDSLDNKNAQVAARVQYSF